MPHLGIDLGTSFVKGAVLDTASRQIRAVRRVPFPAPISGLPAAHVEIDPRAITAAVDQLIHALTAEISDCQGIHLCGQMGGVILVDDALRPRTNYLSWRDQRLVDTTGGGADGLAEISALLAPGQLAALGNELRPGSCTSLLVWLSRRQPELLTGSTPLSLPAYVASHLIGAVAAEDPTLPIGALDLATGDWHREAFAALGIDRFNWPRIESARRPVGFANVGGAKVPCFAAVGDHQCALLGVGLDPEELSVNVSTGSQVSRLAGDAAAGPYQVRHYFDGWLLRTITHLPAGRSLDGLVALFTELQRASGQTPTDPWPYMIRQAEAATDDGPAADIAFFASSVGSEGSFTGLRLENLTVGHLLRASLRNMASNYARCAQQLDPARGWSRLAFSGGLANRLELLRAFVLRQLPGEYRLCAESEDTLTGLLALAMAHDGQAESVLAASAALRSDERQTIDEGMSA